MNELSQKFFRCLVVVLSLMCLTVAAGSFLIARRAEGNGAAALWTLAVALLAAAAGIAAVFYRTRRIFLQLNTMAYKDALTGVRNKASYYETAKKLRRRMEEGAVEFGIVMLDVNFLKETNDTYGHDRGDRLLVESCRIICQVFQHSPVFRFGGDEFVVILENADLEQREELLAAFDERVRRINSLQVLPFAVSISLGLAIYDSQVDKSYDDTFRRADEAMYLNKKELKERLSPEG